MACDSVPRVWSSFVDAFMDFAVGGHVLTGRATPLRPSLRCNSEVVAVPRAHCGQLQEPSSVPAGYHTTGRADDSGGGELAGYEASRLSFPAVRRLVAIGDVHGDAAKARAALKLAGVMGDGDRWTGGETVLVQVGDLLDRGGDEIEVVYLFEKLRREARLAGGAVHVLLGNHETGNIEGWFRYATREGRRDFQRWSAWERVGLALRAGCKGAAVPEDPLAVLTYTNGTGSGGSSGGERWKADLRARAAALRPGSRMVRRFFAHNPTVVQVGSSVFVHGGLLPSHVTDIGLEEMNEQGRRWLMGEREGEGEGKGEGRDKRKGHVQVDSGSAGASSAPPTHPSPPPPPPFFHSRFSPVWLRDYSLPDPSHCNCPALHHTLSLIPGAARLVMGHTIQQPGGISSACGHAAVRVDVGMSSGCSDAPPEVLEISHDRFVRVLAAHREARWMGSQPEMEVVAQTRSGVAAREEKEEEHVLRERRKAVNSSCGGEGGMLKTERTVPGLVPPSQA